MLALSLAPTAPYTSRLVPGRTFARCRTHRIVRSALWALAAATAIGVIMGVLAAVGGWTVYGFTLFFITPLMMGVIAGYVVNRPVPRPVYTTIAAAVPSQTILAVVRASASRARGGDLRSDGGADRPVLS